MVKVCCYPGCRNSKRDRHFANDCLHAFPTEPDVCQSWIRAIPRPNFKPSKESRLCGLHFRPKDYVKVDMHPRLDGENGFEVVDKDILLKPNAIPVSYMDLSAMTPEAQMSHQNNSPDLTFLRDYDDLIHKVPSLQLPQGFHPFQVNRTLHIASFEKAPPPKISYALVIKEDLRFQMWNGSHQLPNESVSDIVRQPSRVSCALDIENILLYLSISSETSEEGGTALQRCVDILEAQEFNEEGDKRRISFIVEQLRLVLLKGRNAVQYSASLLETCARWEKRDSAFYTMLIEKDSFLLPSSSDLRAIGRNSGGEEDEPHSEA